MTIQTKISISVNDQIMEIPSGTTIAQLLSILNVKARGIALELNNEIQTASEFATIVLRPNDSVEVVTLVGGG